MNRMKTFLTYALIVVLFYLFSNFAIDMMISNSFADVSDNVEISESGNGFQVYVTKANSNKRQAYFTGVVKNKSNSVIDKQYVKVDSYFRGKLMQSKYLAFENMKPQEERRFKLSYSVGNIDEYKVSYVESIPENRTIIDDAIDAVIDRSKRFIQKFDAKETAQNIGGAFEPVHVEGENWELFIAVMWVLWCIPLI